MISHKLLRLIVDGLSSENQEPEEIIVNVSTDFTTELSVNYTVGFITVFVNDVLDLSIVADNGTSVEFLSPLMDGDTVKFVVVRGPRAQLLRVLGEETTFNFGDGPVPAHRHLNPNGSLGGWVAESATVDLNVTMDEDSVVFGLASVLGPSSLTRSSVFNEAVVRNSALSDSVVKEASVVVNTAVVRSNVSIGAYIRNSTIVDSEIDAAATILGGDAHIDFCEITGNVFITGNVMLAGVDDLNRVCIEDASRFGENANVEGKVVFTGASHMRNSAGIGCAPGEETFVHGPAMIGQAATIVGNTTIDGPVTVLGAALIEDSNLEDNVMVMMGGQVGDATLTGNAVVYQNGVVRDVEIPTLDTTPLFTADPQSPFNVIGGNTVVPGNPGDVGDGTGSIDGEPNENDD